MFLRFFHINGRLLQVGSVVWTGAERIVGRKWRTSMCLLTYLHCILVCSRRWWWKQNLNGNWVKVMADVYSVSIFCVLSVCLCTKKMFSSNLNASNIYVLNFCLCFTSGSLMKLILVLFRQLSIEFFISHLSISSGIPKHLPSYLSFKSWRSSWTAGETFF